MGYGFWPANTTGPRFPASQAAYTRNYLFDGPAQSAASDEKPDAFLLSPSKSSFPGSVLPAPLVGGPKNSYVAGDSLTLAEQSENGLSMAELEAKVNLARLRIERVLKTLAVEKVRKNR